jgi:hypothetical protein
MGISSKSKEDDEDVDWEDMEGVKSDSTTITFPECGESGLPISASGAAAHELVASSS